MLRIREKQAEVDSAVRMMLGHKCVLDSVFGTVSVLLSSSDTCPGQVRQLPYSEMSENASSDSWSSLLVAKPRAEAAEQKAQGLKKMHLGKCLWSFLLILHVCECSDWIRVWHRFWFSIFSQMHGHTVDGNAEGNFGDTERCSLGKKVARLVVDSQCTCHVAAYRWRFGWFYLR